VAKGLQPVGSYNRNDFGLFDMIGNVPEWSIELRPSTSSRKLATEIRVHGGGFGWWGNDMEIYTRAFQPQPTDTNGFRCVIDP